jgi:hypothetical protein
VASAWATSWGTSWGSSWGPLAQPLSLDLPEPFGLTFDDWGARVAQELAQFAVPHPSTESQWKDWAASLYYVDALAQKNIPSPLGFDDWRLWASRFLETVR